VSFFSEFSCGARLVLLSWCLHAVLFRYIPLFAGFGCGYCPILLLLHRNEEYFLISLFCCLFWKFNMLCFTSRCVNAIPFYVVITTFIPPLFMYCLTYFFRSYEPIRIANKTVYSQYKQGFTNSVFNIRTMQCFIYIKKVTLTYDQLV
jgi:hypothetical protein